MSRSSGLGRGLGALIPSESGSAGGGQLREVAVGQIQPNERQPRKTFAEDSLEELAASIRQLGLLQPVLVRQVGEDAYELIAGERRWRASQRAGLTTIPALVRTVEDEGSLEQALVENLHRDDLNALEEAAAYQQLATEFGLTQDEVATRVGRSRSAVANTVRLLQLPEPVQGMLVDGGLSAGHGRALLGLPDPDRQEALAREVIEQGLTVREVEERIRREVMPAPPVSPSAEDGTEAAPGATRPAALLELEGLLADLLDTRVRVRMGAKRSRIEIDFADLEDLERIYLTMTKTA